VSNLDQQIPTLGVCCFSPPPLSASSGDRECRDGAVCSEGCIACRRDIPTSAVRRLHPVTALSNYDERMSLARIAPGAPALDTRTFECASCHHDALLWLAGYDLKSPT
jgi:hypothetical protein